MKKIELLITKQASQKLRYYVEECPAEISGFGKIRELEDTDEVKQFQLYDVEILPQTVGGADATISEEELAMFLTRKMRAKKSTIAYKCWWHSHNNFGVFFSGTDTGTIDGSHDFPYLISLVTNKAGEMLARLDIYEPMRLIIEDIDIILEEEENEELREKIRKEIEKKVIVNHGYHFGKKRDDDKNETSDEKLRSIGFDYNYRRDYGYDYHNRGDEPERKTLFEDDGIDPPGDEEGFDGIPEHRKPFDFFRKKR